jgi:hypothetical protein
MELSWMAGPIPMMAPVTKPGSTSMSFVRWLVLLTTLKDRGAESPVAKSFGDNAWLSEPRDVRVGGNSKKIVSDIDILGRGHIPAEK